MSWLKQRPPRPQVDPATIQDAAGKLQVLYANMRQIAEVADRERRRLAEQMDRSVPCSELEAALLDVLRRCPSPLTFEAMIDDVQALASLLGAVRIVHPAAVQHTLSDTEGVPA